MPINNNDLAYLATLAETAPKPDPSGMALHLVKLARAVNGGTCDYVDTADDIARLIDAFADARDGGKDTRMPDDFATELRRQSALPHSVMVSRDAKKSPARREPSGAIV